MSLSQEKSSGPFFAFFVSEAGPVERFAFARLAWICRMVAMVLSLKKQKVDLLIPWVCKKASLIEALTY